MNGLDLTLPRMRSRWRKLRRDPAAFADDLPWPVLRFLAIGGLAGLTALRRPPAAQERAWAAAGVALRRPPNDPGLRLCDDAAAAPACTPELVEVGPVGRRLVLCALDGEDQLLGAVELAPDRPAVLALRGRQAVVRAYALDGQPTPLRLPVRPAGQAQLMRLSLAQGLDQAEALRRAWPAAEGRTPEPSARAYREWISRNEPQAQDRRAIAALAARPGSPKVSILMPVHDPRPEHLSAAVHSVRDQIGEGWELCIADDGSGSDAVRDVLAEAAKDPRVRCVRLERSQGVAAATNAALALASGDVCLFLDHDDVLAPHATAVIASAFAEEAELVAVYSDEDTIDAAGRRSAPLFKPDVDRWRLYAQNYVNHAFAIRTAVLRDLGGLREGVDGAQDHDLVLRAVRLGPIRRLPHVLYHWRVYPGGASLSQGAAAAMTQARARVVSDALRDDAIAAEIAPGVRGRLDVRLRLDQPQPSILAIVPTRDSPGLLSACAAGLLDQTRYDKLELCVVDNGSCDPDALGALEALRSRPRAGVLRIDAPFNFSALNNAAAAHATADLLLFLNDDVLVIEPDWLARMAALAMQPDVGAVGAKLLYADGRIQHAGLVTGLGPQGVAGHEFRAQPGDAPGPQGRLDVLRQVSAVTAACLLVRRDRFQAVGGFDEALAVAFNDVDLCLRLAEAGWSNLWTPHARLIHLESTSRGRDADPERAARFASEAAFMHQRWGERLAKDPFYNPNLTLDDESFGLARRSRAPAPWRKL